MAASTNKQEAVMGHYSDGPPEGERRGVTTTVGDAVRRQLADELVSVQKALRCSEQVLEAEREAQNRMNARLWAQRDELVSVHEQLRELEGQIITARSVISMRGQEIDRLRALAREALRSDSYTDACVALRRIAEVDG